MRTFLDAEIHKKKTIRGLGLVSGGLDSLIACFLMKQQGIQVVGINFSSPFCLCSKMYKNSECGISIFQNKLNIKVVSIPKDDDYLEIVRNPKYGYGKNINPCVDCRIYILKKAKRFAEENGFDFIFTGEVMNQRLKSQFFKSLKAIERESELKGLLLRPLSAHLLEPTIMEKKGFIDRTKLLGIKGRSRKTQLDIAKKYNLLDNYHACGGCLLTDVKFSNRMRDYFKFNKTTKMEDIIFLKYGRHFRYKGSKIIVGRNEFENNVLSNIKKNNDISMEVENYPGPITLVQGEISEDILRFAARLTMHYSDFKGKVCKIKYSNHHNLISELLVKNDGELSVEKYLL
ncbi:MAG: hypothetical protein ACFFAS_09195 [Promethearchaeota archaeon]